MANRSLAWVLLCLYGATGMTALAYEVLWTRMLSLMFGVSIFGVVFTVAAFMAGLGAGSFLATTRGMQYSPARSWRMVAWLEAGIAAYALALPVCMPWLDGGLVSLGTGLSLPAWQGLQGGAVLLLLFPPALAMGMAFPLALRAATGARLTLASMYGVNALGGAIGAVLPLLLLPLFGWRSSLWVVAGFGMLLAVCALYVARHLPGLSADSDKDKHHAGAQRPPWADLLAYAGIGAAALMLEVLWTREYGMLLLRTEYILAVLLLVYLAGIGLGSLLAARMRAAVWLNLLPVLAALAAVAGQYALSSISQWAGSSEFSSLLTAMLEQGGMVALCTLPVTLLLGAWLPLLARHFHQQQSEAGGWWYGANSIGAAAGALLAGFIMLPLLGTALSLLLAATMLLLCGMRWVRDRRLWLSLPLLLVIAWPVHSLPPVSRLLPALPASTDLSVYEDAVSLTHVVEQGNGQRVLLSDLQRMDASTDPTAVTVQKNQARLPLLLHPAPRTVLFLGLGTGITASGSLPFTDLERTAVELSQGAINAAGSWFAPVNGDINGQVHIIHDDARRFLRTDDHHYDVIVGDLFHPDMVGRANLLSLQQFQRAKERLNDGGIFVQWLALNQFDVASIKVVMHTFASVFKHASLFVDGYRIALVGHKGDPAHVHALLHRYGQMSDTAKVQTTGGEGIWTWLGRYWGEIPDFSTPLQDEWAPVIEYSLPKVRFGDGVDMESMWRWLLSWRSRDDIAAQSLGVAASDMQTFRRARVATALNVRLWQAELDGDERRVVEMARLAYRANPKDRWPAFALADRMYDSLAHLPAGGLSRREALMRILTLRPDHESALRAMMQLEQQQGHVAAAALWQQRLHTLSPLAKNIRER
ncbi:fused MFS/spermidine synthase [Mariprofundus ferrooxydans]|uniref:fused MFS/spermidine synthase n=1 Tax=Mariprofundus ferrooxydans TaxID=314344 RepID=UPI00036B900C|nr:fused MFS/spermidine synthase [Mariprofundus ferrooxydans]